MPRQPLKGVISGHSIKGTRAVKLKDCGLAGALMHVKYSVFDGSFKGLDGGFPAYGELIGPDDLRQRFFPHGEWLREQSA